MHPSVAYEANRTSIRSFAWKVLRRAYAAGARTVQIQDIEQELSLAWVKAAQGFDPERGVLFKTYLMNGMKQHINRWADVEIGASRFAPYSLDKTMIEGEGEEFHEIIADQSESPEEICHNVRFRQTLSHMLSEKAELFLRLLEDPPPEVVEVFRALQAKAQFARQRGMSCFVNKTITEAMIFDLMGIGAAERYKIRKEIKRAVEKVKGNRI